MSVVDTSRIAPGPPGPTFRPRRLALARAEAGRWHHSAAARVPLVGLAIAAQQALLATLSQQRQGWTSLLAWQSLWVTGVLPVALAVLVSLADGREAKARGAATWWRPNSPLGRDAFHVAALLAYSALLHGLVLATNLPFGWAVGLGFPGPVGKVLALIGVLTVTSTALVVMLDGVGRRFGMVPTALAGLAWGLAGVALAERSYWWAVPFTWHIRAAQPFMGTHANGVPLEPDSPLWHTPAWPAALGSVVLGGVLFWWARRVRPGEGGSRAWARRRDASVISRLPVVGRYRLSVAGSLLRSLRRTAVAPLVAAGMAVIALGTALGWSPRTLVQFSGLLLLPFGAMTLAATAWWAQSPAWRALATRVPSPGRLGRSLIAVLTGLLWVCVAVAGAALAARGLPAGRLAAVTAVALTTSFALVALHVLVAVRFGTGVTMLVGFLGTVAGLVMSSGGGAVAWPVNPWVWIAVALEGISPVGMLAGGLVLGAVCTWATGPAARRAAALGGD